MVDPSLVFISIRRYCPNLCIYIWLTHCLCQGLLYKHSHPLHKGICQDAQQNLHGRTMGSKHRVGLLPTELSRIYIWEWEVINYLWGGEPWQARWILLGPWLISCKPMGPVLISCTPMGPWLTEWQISKSFCFWFIIWQQLVIFLVLELGLNPTQMLFWCRFWIW